MKSTRERITGTDDCGAPITETERWLIVETPGGRLGQRFVGADECARWIARLAPVIRRATTWWCDDWFPS